MSRTRLFLAALTLCAASTLFAEKITFSANSMSGIVGDKSDSSTLSGNAYVLTETMEISADKITLSGTDFRFIEASGSITGKNMESQLEFTCGRLSYDRETKVALLMDNVDLKDIQNDVKAKAQIIEYNQQTDIAVMQIEITLTQKDNVCSGAYAVYRKKTQLLELSGNAQIKQGSDTFRAQEITLDLNSQEITLDGRVKGSIVDDRKSAEKEESTKSDEQGSVQATTDESESEQASSNEKSDSAEQTDTSTTDATNTANTEVTSSTTENSASNADATEQIDSKKKKKSKGKK